MTDNIIKLEPTRKVNHSLVESLERALADARGGHHISGAYVAMTPAASMVTFFSIGQNSPYPERTCLIGACNELIARMVNDT